MAVVVLLALGGDRSGRLGFEAWVQFWATTWILPVALAIAGAIIRAFRWSG